MIDWQERYRRVASTYVLLTLIMLCMVFQVALWNDREYDEFGVTVGKYNHNQGRITLWTEGQWPTSLQKTAQHEICHYVWFQYLPEPMRKQYETIHSNANTFVTLYSRTDVKEDFAEHCAYWVLGDMLDPKREAWFDKHLEPYMRRIQ